MEKSTLKLQRQLEGWSLPRPEDFLWLTETGVKDPVKPIIRFTDRNGNSRSFSETLRHANHPTREALVDFAVAFLSHMKESGDPGAFAAICAWSEEIAEALRETNREPLAA